MNLDVTFIIPSYNSHKTLRRTVESILRQTAVAHIKEVIIVDSSDDGATKDYLSGLKSPLIVIIHLPQKTSPALGRNAGARQATGSLVCFIDSDVFLDEDWLIEVMAEVVNGAKIGCGSVSVPDFQRWDVLSLAQLYLQFNESLFAGNTRPIKMVPACNLFCERNLFNELNGFPNIRASEDVLLCLKAGKITTVWFVPKAKCYHIFREDIDAYFRNQIVLGKYIITYRRQYYQKFFYQGVWPLGLLPAFLLLKFFFISGRIIRSGLKHTLLFLWSLPLFLVGLFYWAVGFVQGCLGNEKSE